MSEHTLLELQASFQKFILEDDQSFLELIQAKNAEHALSRADIYGNAYVSRLYEVIEVEYPTLANLLGEEIFGDIVYDYLAANPSVSPDLRVLCNGLVEFLENDQRYNREPLWQALALFERAIALATEAPEQSIKSLEDLQNVPQANWPSLRFQFHPSLQTLDSAWPLDMLWQAHAEGQALPQIQPDLEDSKFYVFWRYENMPQLLALELSERWMLLECIAGKNFAAVCDSLCELMDEAEVPDTAINYLVKWLQSGWIVALDQTQT